MRIYYEVHNDGQWEGTYKLWSNLPLGLSYFPGELLVVPKTYVDVRETWFTWSIFDGAFTQVGAYAWKRRL